MCRPLTSRAARRRAGAAAAAVLLAASLLASCSADSGVGSSAALKVNDWTLPNKDLDSLLTQYSEAQLLGAKDETERKTAFDRMHGNDVAKKTWSSAFTAFVLNEIMQNEVIHQEFVSRKLPTPKLDPADLAQFISGLGDEAKYKKLPKLYRENTERRQAEFAAMIASEKAKLGDAKTYYAKNKANFVEVCAAHILVDTEKEALDLKAKIDGGADLAALAKTSSKDTGSGAAGGELGCADPAGFVPEFAEATRTLPIGKLSAPVKTQFGYHLIRVSKRDAQPFEKVEATITTKIQEQAQGATSDKLVARIKAAKIVIDPNVAKLQPLGQQGFPEIVSKTTAVAPSAPAGASEAPAPNAAG
jgi:PPIC-type PPIASE domain